MGSSIDLSKIVAKIPPEDANFHRGTVADLLGRNNLNFPGAQPVSFSRKHFQELQQKDYYMCEKTDGIRCLLYLTELVLGGGQPQEAQFLIDRKNDYYYVQTDFLHLPLQGNLGAYHTGTLLDGELVLQKLPGGEQRLNYLIFDCLCLDKQNVMNRQLDVRLGKIRAFIYEPWKELKARYPEDVAAQPFQLQIKDMQLPYGAEMMFRDIIPKLPHGNDGLIFTCKETPYSPGTDPHILKWKPPHENTIDFRLQIGEFPTDEDGDGMFEDFDAQPHIDLLVNYGGRNGYKVFSTLSLTDSEWEACKSLSQELDGRIIECFRDPSDGNWRPKTEHDTGAPRFRDDKREANHISVVESVLDSIEDAVSEQDLVAQAGKIREAWKRREAWRKEARQKAAAQPAQRPPAPNQEEVDDGPKYDD